MHLEVVEVLALAGEGAAGSHWSRNTARPRYSLGTDEAKQASFHHSFTCFDVAERVEADHDIVFAGRSNGAVVLWRMVARNMFGGANKNDRVEEPLVTASPHRGAVTCLTHTRQGTYGSLIGPLMFSGSTDHTIKVWDAWAGPPFKEACLQTMAEHRGGVTALAFAGDTTLISIARDGSVRLWRPQRGRKLLRFPFFCCVKCLFVYPTAVGRGMSRSIGAGQPGAFVHVWPTAACVAGGETWTFYCGDSNGTVSVFQRAPTSAAKRLANARKTSDSLTMNQLADDEVTLHRRWTHLHSLAITGLVLVAEHNFLLSVGNDGACRVLDYLQQGNTFMTIESDGHNLFTSVAWDLAHEQLVLADASGVVQVWNTYTESLLLKKKVAKAVTYIGPRKGQSLKALMGFHSSKADGMIYGMSPSEGCFFRWKLVKADSSVLIGRHDESILGLGFQGAPAYPSRRNAPSNDGGIDIAGRAGNMQKHEDRSEKNHVDESKGSCTGVVRTTCNELEGTGLECDGDKRPTDQRGSHGNVGRVAEIHYNDTEASEEDTKDEEEGEQEEKGGKEEEASFGLVILSASLNGVIRAWETLGKSEKYCMRHSGGAEVTSMLVLPGGSVLVTGTDDGSVRFWQLDTGAGESYKAHDNSVSALAAYSDQLGSLVLASAGFEGAIIIWRAHPKDGLKKDRVPTVDYCVRDAHGALDGLDGEILCLAFVASDVPVLASAGNDRVVRCWRLRERTCILLLVLEGHEDSIEALVSDGLFLFSGSCDGAVRVWNVSNLEHEDDNVSLGDNSRHRGEMGRTEAMMVGAFKAHPNGVSGMAVMTSERNCRADVVYAGRESHEAGGLIATCGKAEGIVKIWDYTHVEDDGTCGRLITEFRSQDESLFNCVACTQDILGKPLLFAGTNEGSILQLAYSGIDEGNIG
ncbi:unnamed protein product [Ectocarpus sp. 12 AP-2014]